MYKCACCGHVKSRHEELNGPHNIGRCFWQNYETGEKCSCRTYIPTESEKRERQQKRSSREINQNNKTNAAIETIDMAPIVLEFMAKLKRIGHLDEPRRTKEIEAMFDPGAYLAECPEAGLLLYSASETDDPDVLAGLAKLVDYARRNSAPYIRKPFIIARMLSR